MLKKFRENLKYLRKKNKVSRKVLAEELGVTEITVYNWETGKSDVSVTSLMGISSFFKVKVDALLSENLDDRRRVAIRSTAKDPIMEYDLSTINSGYKQVPTCPFCGRVLDEHNEGRFCKYCGQEISGKIGFGDDVIPVKDKR